jgi:hypothetical protein
VDVRAAAARLPSAEFLEEEHLPEEAIRGEMPTQE